MKNILKKYLFLSQNIDPIFKSDLYEIVKISKNINLIKQDDLNNKISFEKEELHEQQSFINFEKNQNLNYDDYKNSRFFNNLNRDIFNKKNNLKKKFSMQNLNFSTTLFNFVKKNKFESTKTVVLLDLINKKNEQHQFTNIIEYIIENSKRLCVKNKIFVPKDYKSENFISKEFIGTNKIKDGAVFFINNKRLSLTSESFLENMKNFVKQYLYERVINER